MHSYMRAKDLWVEAEWATEHAQKMRSYAKTIVEVNVAIAGEKGMTKVQLAGCWHLKGLVIPTRPCAPTA